MVLPLSIPFGFMALPGAAAASYFLSPRNAVSVGASGAIFGLFAVSVLVRLRWDLRRLLEGAILGQFVVQQVGGGAGCRIKLAYPS